MDFFDFIFNRNAAHKEKPGRLSSYGEAAELICMCWNKLDMSFIEPYLDENMLWKGGVPHKVINGKEKNSITQNGMTKNCGNVWICYKL